MTGYVFVRPDGRPYRPRKSGLRARAWENHGCGDEEGSGVIVFGTLNPDEARRFALESATYWFGTGTVHQPISGWWRDSFDQGERRWVEDEQRGAPGVMFTWEAAYYQDTAAAGPESGDPS